MLDNLMKFSADTGADGLEDHCEHVYSPRYRMRSAGSCLPLVRGLFGIPWIASLVKLEVPLNGGLILELMCLLHAVYIV